MTSSSKLAKVLVYYGLISSVNELTQKVICPFHKDVNPSMIIDLERDKWFCFGCNLSGDALRFVELVEQKYNGLNQLHACMVFNHILKSNKTNHIQVLQNTSQAQQKQPQSDLINEAKDYYYGLRKVRWEAPGVDEEVSAKQYMLERGFNELALNQCKAKVTYNTQYGLIFPMLDNNIFKGWVCRTMLPEIEAKRKYLYNKGFSRASTLVGNYGSLDYVFIVEGYMDRLKFIQYGKENVVAILGWKMSAEQIQKLKDKGITTIISALDNDECGRRGTKYLEQFFNVIRFKYIKGIKDPGEMSKGMFMKCYRKTMMEVRSI